MTGFASTLGGLLATGVVAVGTLFGGGSDTPSTAESRTAIVITRGWTTDGRAIVFIPATPSVRGDCRAQSDPGLYLATTDLDMTRVGDKDVPRSIDARTPAEVSRAAG